MAKADSARSSFDHDFTTVPAHATPRATSPPLPAMNEPGDRYEQEADRVAAQVMRMQRSDAGPMVATVAVAAVQRHPSASAAASISNAPARDDSDLMSGGEAMPRALQSFYENRFGRDFSQVRLHTGKEAHQRNDAIHAEAFTYGNHIWLGHEVAPAPSVILAHELAHVVQQTQPSEKPPAEGEAAPTGQLSAPRQIQRFAPYWEPFDYDGSKTHGEVLPLIGKESGIFTEAPVPNARRDKLGPGSAADYGKRGYADFYSGSTTVGVYFEKFGEPKSLPSSRDSKKDGEKFSHVKTSAPNLEGSNGVGRVDQAPAIVKVGDLKPSHGTLEALEGATQVTDYLKGFQLAAGEVNGLPDDRRKPAGKTWTLSTDALGRKDVKIPAKYQHPSAAGQTSQTIIVKHNGRKHAPSKPTKGKLFVMADPQNAGIWNYFWQPDSPVQSADLPKEIGKLHQEIKQYIIDPLTASPVKKKPKLRAIPPPAVPTSLALSQDKRRVIARKGAVNDPSFDLEKWKTDHKRLTGVEAAAEKTTDFKEAEFTSMAAKAQTATKESTGAAIPEVPANTREASSALGRVKFWTGKSSAVFGPMRKVFGGAFVKVAQFYEKARDKFSAMLKKNSSKEVGSKNTIQGAAVRACFRVLKLVAAYLIKQTAQRLIESLEKGVVQKLRSLVEGEFEELEEKVKEVEQLKNDLELKALEEVEELVEKTLGPYEEIIERIRQVEKIVQDIRTIVNWVEWAVRVAEVAECATLIGCLAVIVQEGAKVIVARAILGSCWFQRKIIPLVTGIDFVKNLPIELAGIIVKSIKERLPEKLHDVFADIDVSGIEATEKDIKCEDDDEEDEPKEELSGESAALRDAILDLVQSVDEEKLRALGEFMKNYGINSSEPPNLDRIREVKAALLDSKVTAAEIRKFMERNPTLPFSFSGLGDLMKKVRAGAGAVPAKPPAQGTQPPSRGPFIAVPPVAPGDLQRGTGPFGDGIRF
ncbi:MAG: DUF4157 domain-containing protein [Chthoniobacteraceae bacterium]